MSLYAVNHVRKMRGGAQAHLMRASDGAYWVCKLRENPQHIRVLANEMFVTRLGRCLGLPMPQVEAIEIGEWLIANTPEFRLDLEDTQIPCSSGMHLASRFVADIERDMVVDYLPETMMGQVDGLINFARVLVLDKWTANCDGRQAVFWKKKDGTKFRLAFIDQGYCLNAGQWTFPDQPLHGVYCRNLVYQGVTGWQSFEHVLSRTEQMDCAELWQCAAGIPEEWYENDKTGLARIVETLYKRRSIIRCLISDFRHSSRNPFPNWPADS